MSRKTSFAKSSMAHRILQDGEKRTFVENGFRLSTKPSLLHVVTSLSLGEQRVFALLVLGHFVQFMPFAFFAHAQRHTSFGNDNLTIINVVITQS